MNDWFEAEQHAQRAQHFYEMGQWQRALQELRKALRVHPDRAEWLLGLGLTLEALGQYADAARAFDQAMQLGDDDPETAILLAVNYLREDQPNKALDVLQTLAEREPTYEDALSYQIIAYAQMGKHEQARKVFEQTCELNAYSARAYEHLGHSFSMQQQHQRAIEAWRKAAALDPSIEDLYLNMGRAYMQLGKMLQAKRQFRRHLRHEPEDVDAMLELARLLVNMGRYGEAEETLRTASEYEPDHARVQAQLGELALLRQHNDAARRRLIRAMELDPAISGVRLGLAMLARDAGEYEQARKYLIEELACDEHIPNQILEIARLLIELDRPARAAAIITSVLEGHAEDSAAFSTSQDRALALLYRGTACLLLGESEQGIKDCRRSLYFEPANSVTRQNLILAYLRNDQLARAGVLLRQMRSTHRKHKDYRRLLWLWRYRIWSLRVKKIVPQRIFNALFPSLKP